MDHRKSLFLTTWTLLFSLLVSMVVLVEAAHLSPLPDDAIVLDAEEDSAQNAVRKLFKLVSNRIVLPYHNGPLLTGRSSLNVYLIWYGDFSPAQKATIVDFLGSFEQTSEAVVLPSVSSWWKVTAGYKDAKNEVPFSSVSLAGQKSDAYSLGKKLKTSDIEALLLEALAPGSSPISFPADSKAIYFVLTAHDVFVQDFCMNACASHFFTSPTPAVDNLMLPYAWVGNSAEQCPGICAWPFALPQFAPIGAKPLIPPNGDVGIAGIIINMASMMAGAATNPFNNGYYQGDASSPLEAATACIGIYGQGAYPGFPGELLVQPISGASYNADGINDRKFLLPALWNPTTLACTPPS